MVTPSSRSLRSSVAERLLLLAAQAGGRLVEHEQHRVGGERARDLEHALGAERQAAGQLVRAVAEADAVELALRLGEDLGFLGAVEPQAGAQHAGARARRSAPSATLSSRLICGRSLTCWKVRAMPRRATSRCGRPVMSLAEERAPARRSSAACR